MRTNKKKPNKTAGKANLLPRSSGASTSSILNQQPIPSTTITTSASSSSNNVSIVPQPTPSGTTIVTTLINDKPYEKLTKTNLENLCKDRCIPKSGSKEQLRQRLIRFDEHPEEFEKIQEKQRKRKIQPTTNQTKQKKTKQPEKQKRKTMTTMPTTPQQKKKQKATSKTCEHCSKTFKSKKELRGHLKKEHNYVPEGWKSVTVFEKEIPKKEGGKPSSTITNGSSYELFRQLFTDEIELHLQQKTNEKCSSFKIKQVSIEELRQYFAIIFTMGLVRMPEMGQYWTDDEKQLFGNGLVRATLSRNRFKEIHRCLSFDIDWLVSKVCDIIGKCWIPTETCVVDECIIPFKGRFRGRQHVRGKPHATGLKLFMLCDNTGMPISFWLYRGKDNDKNESDTTVDYVVDLAKKLPNRDTRKYTILADQFYGSAKLAEELDRNNFDYVFSCQSNHPSDLFSDHLHTDIKEQGQTSFLVRNDEKCCALSFYDSGKCNFISSISNTNIPQAEKERNEKNKKKRARCGIVRFYNMNMGGVDQFDAALNLYHFKCRNRSWKRSLGFAMFKTLIVGSLRLFQAFNSKPNGKKPQQLGHVVSIIYGLSSRNPRYKEPAILHQHYPMHAKKGKHCVYCLQHGIKSNSKYVCTNCQHHLHPKCWIKYHLR